MPNRNRPHLSAVQVVQSPVSRPKVPYYIPGYYTPASTPPIRPGWYFCERPARLCYLYWRDGAFWDNGTQAGDVAYWVELPGFVQRVLKTDPKVV